MSNFSQRIKEIEARINRLKTLGMKSSASLAVTSQQITIPNGYNRAKIIITPAQDALIAAYVVQPTTIDPEAGVGVRFDTDENFRTIVLLNVASGYTLQNYVVEIVSTSTFTYELEMA